MEEYPVTGRSSVLYVCCPLSACDSARFGGFQGHADVEQRSIVTTAR